MHSLFLYCFIAEKRVIRHGTNHSFARLKIARRNDTKKSFRFALQSFHLATSSCVFSLSIFHILSTFLL